MSAIFSDGSPPARPEVTMATTAKPNNAGGIGYSLLRQQDAMQRLKELETLHPT
jgi:hypothetical protein